VAKTAHSIVAQHCPTRNDQKYGSLRGSFAVHPHDSFSSFSPTKACAFPIQSLTASQVRNTAFAVCDERESEQHRCENLRPLRASPHESRPDLETDFGSLITIRPIRTITRWGRGTYRHGALARLWEWSRRNHDWGLYDTTVPNSTRGNHSMPAQTTRWAKNQFFASTYIVNLTN